jgi:MFS family permease
MMLLNVAVFLPTFLDDKNDLSQDDGGWVTEDGYTINANDVSLIIAVFSVAQILFAPFNSLLKNKIGAKSLVLLGFLLLTVTTVGLGAIAKVSNPHNFKWFAIGLRFF